jgi:hypothetical protein
MPFNSSFVKLKGILPARSAKIAFNVLSTLGAGNNELGADLYRGRSVV